MERKSQAMYKLGKMGMTLTEDSGYDPESNSYKATIILKGRLAVMGKCGVHQIHSYTHTKKTFWNHVCDIADTINKWTEPCTHEYCSYHDKETVSDEA